jgi:plasmid maintenance system antidote protein VapI
MKSLLGVPVDYQTDLLSSEVALRIERVLGVKMDTLMRMQSAYEIAQTRKREGDKGEAG